MLEVDLGRNAAQRVLLPAQVVHLFVEVGIEALLAGSRHFCRRLYSWRNLVRGRLHSHDLPCIEYFQKAVICAAKTREHCKALFCLFSIMTCDHVPSTPGDGLLELPEAQKNQYGAWLMNVAGSAPRRFSAVNLDGTLAHRKKKRFHKTGFLIAVVENCLHCFCIETLATYEQPGTEFVSEPSWMALFRAANNVVLMDRKLVKLISLSIMFLEHILGDTSITAFFKSLFQFSNSFDSSYDASFQETLVACISEDRE